MIINSRNVESAVSACSRAEPQGEAFVPARSVVTTWGPERETYIAKQGRMIQGGGRFRNKTMRALLVHLRVQSSSIGNKCMDTRRRGWEKLGNRI